MRFKKASALFIALAVVGVACGSDKKTATTSAGATTPPAGSSAPAATTPPAGSSAPAASGDTLIIATDLPLQGASKDASADTNNAIALLIEQAGGKAGAYPIAMKAYDDSTAAKGKWDDATCAKNASDHVANKAEVAVMGTYNSGCAKIEVPTLNEDPAGPMLMVSHANTNVGLTKAWEPGEPDKYYPTGIRNYARVVTTDDFQGQADAQFVKQDLKLSKCVVLNDAQTYGVGVARAFKEEAAKQGITIVADQAWDSKQPNYTALFEGFKDLNPDCIFLGGINDNNGEQLVKDKVAVLGPNSGAVKLIAPDGFTGYPSLLKLTESADMYISFAGLPGSELLKNGGAGAKFATDFKTKYGHAPASAYAIYGAAATQFIMKAIAASDGTRKGIRDAAFSGNITITAEESVIGKAFSIDPKSGDVSVHDLSIQVVKDHVETFLKAWPLDV